MVLKLAWRNLWRNKRRTLITMASVFFAVLLAVSMRSLQEGVYQKMIENVVSFFTGYVQIHQDGYWDDQIIDNSFEQSVVVEKTAGKVRDVSNAIPRLESFALASAGSKSKPAQVIGINPVLENSLTHLESKLMAGEYLAENDRGALVAEGLAEKLKLGVGDTLILIGAGYHGIMANGLYPIRGLVSFGSPILNQGLVYLSLQEAQTLYGAENRLTSYALNLSDPTATDEVTQSLGKELGDNYEVMNWKEMMPELIQQIDSDKLGGYIMMGILYLIIGFGIFGTVLMMTSERQYEFGVLVAIGMKKLKLGFVVFFETLFIASLGIIAGILASLPIVLYFQSNPIYMGDEMAKAYEQFGIEPVIPMALEPSVLISQAIVVLVVTTLIGLYPIWKISRIEPVEAMRV